MPFHLRSSNPTGSIIPMQVLARSHGIFSSKCREERQLGQWFLADPFGCSKTSAKQTKHTNDSFRIINPMCPCYSYKSFLQPNTRYATFEL